jgi:hypothetical protein
MKEFFELIGDIQVMEVAIIDKGQQSFAWAKPALSAMKKTAGFHTRSDLAFRTTGMDIALIRAAALAWISFDPAALILCQFKQVFSFRKRSSIVSTGSAVQAASSQQTELRIHIAYCYLTRKTTVD